MTQESLVEAEIIGAQKLEIDPALIAAGIAHLCAVDEKLAALIAAVGPLTLTRETDLYSALIRAIIAQQISVKAEQAIYGRVRGLFGPDSAPSPQKMLDLPDEMLRAAGLSRQKIAYMKDLSSRVVAGTLDLSALPEMNDEDIIAALVAVKGIGRWTAEMLLIFALGRLDVWPVDDLGIGVGVQQLYSLPARPTPKELRGYGGAWQPFRSLACLYLWRSRAVLPAI